MPRLPITVLGLLAVAFSLTSMVAGTWLSLSTLELPTLGRLMIPAYLLSLGGFALSISGLLGWDGARQKVGLQRRIGVALGLLGGILIATATLHLAPTRSVLWLGGLFLIVAGPVTAMSSLSRPLQNARFATAMMWGVAILTAVTILILAQLIVGWQVGVWVALVGPAAFALGFSLLLIRNPQLLDTSPDRGEGLFGSRG